jgi:hypothetical protein
MSIVGGGIVATALIDVRCGPKKMWQKGGGEGEGGGGIVASTLIDVRCGPKKKVKKEIPPECIPRLSPRPIKKKKKQQTTMVAAFTGTDEHEKEKRNPRKQQV